MTKEDFAEMQLLIAETKSERLSLLFEMLLAELCAARQKIAEMERALP